MSFGIEPLAAGFTGFPYGLLQPRFSPALRISHLLSWSRSTASDLMTEVSRRYCLPDFP
jgi:hypothetical protein